MSRVVRNNTSGSVQLSPHFFLSEFIESDTADRLGIDNTPPAIIVPRLFQLAKLLEEVRTLLGGKVITVTSGYRCPELNVHLGSGPGSEHPQGMAADFKCRTFGTPLQICHAIAKSGIKFGQLIEEGTWVHISLPDGRNDGQVLTAIFTPGGATCYQQGLRA